MSASGSKRPCDIGVNGSVGVVEGAKQYSFPSRRREPDAAAASDTAEIVLDATHAVEARDERGAPPTAETISIDDRLKEIRKVLSEVGADATPEPGHDHWQRAVLDARRTRARDDDGGGRDGGDDLKSRLDRLSNSGRLAKAEPTRDYDISRIRRAHEKRAKRYLRAKSRRRTDGGFLAGFTFVSVVAAALVGLYVMHPQVIEAQPKWAPAINEYVVTVDRLRLEGDEQTKAWRAWIATRFNELTGGEG